MKNEKLNVNELSPYVSVIPFEIMDTADFQYMVVADMLLAQLEALLKLSQEESKKNKKELEWEGINSGTLKGWHMRGCWHTVRSFPRWIAKLDESKADLLKSKLSEKKSHLSLITLKENFLFLLFTDQTVGKKMQNYVLAEFRPGGKKVFQSISPDVASLAFLQGEAKQLYMSGLHRQTNFKPDAKTLAGQDLREAINPFSDQTYKLNAAVSKWIPSADPIDFAEGLPADSPLRELTREDALSKVKKPKEKVVGLSFRDGLIWTKSTQTMEGFVSELDDLTVRLKENLHPLDNKTGFDQTGYRELRRPEKSAMRRDLGKAIDFSFEFPLFDERNLEKYSDQEIQAIDFWRFAGTFEIVNTDEERIFIDIKYENKLIAQLRVQPILNLGGKVDFNLSTNATIEEENTDTFRNLEVVLKDFKQNSTIWYEDGFVVTQGEMFNLNYRDVPFSSWVWHDLSGYDATKEKPEKFSGHSWDGDSLFDYVVRNSKKLFEPKGEWHLLCDDGSGEIADFVYIDSQSKKLKLIHIKAADGGIREIAPGKYEVVISQAEKNLRFLDVPNLLEKLESYAGAVLLSLVWTNGKKMENRDSVIKALRNLGNFPEKEVIVFQPHTLKTIWDGSETELRTIPDLSVQKKVQFLRLKTLLAGLEQNSKAVGADFRCWGEDKIASLATLHKPPKKITSKAVRKRK